MKLIVPVNKDDHIKGKETAPVTLVEYGDFECSYCGEMYPVVKEILKDKKNEIRFVFRNFPLAEIHPHALKAACAGEAAAKQGKFWEMHDYLFENQDDLEDQALLMFAKKLNLEIAQFEKDMRSEETKKKVQAHFIGGVKSGVNGTPTLFINGVRYEGPHELKPLLNDIESAAKLNSH